MLSLVDTEVEDNMVTVYPHLFLRRARRDTFHRRLYSSSSSSSSNNNNNSCSNRPPLRIELPIPITEACT